MIKPKVSIIIAEKPSVAAALAERFAPRGANIEDFAWKDSFAYKFDKNRVPANVAANLFYWERDFAASRRLSALDTQSKDGRKKSRPRGLYSEDRAERKRQEHFTYYVVPTTLAGIDYIMIGDTRGNPLQPIEKLPPRERGLANIETSGNWQEFEKKLGFTVGRDGPWARCAWFRYVISSQQFPCDISTNKRGQSFELVNIYSATDYDVAGQYISYSIFQYGRQGYGRNFRSPIPVDEDRLVRLDMGTLTPEDICASFCSPERFNWGMALGGEVRSKVDYLIGFYSRLLSGVWGQVRKDSDYFSEANLPFGRVQTGALGVLCNLDQNISRLSERYLYLIFDGILSWPEIQSAQKQGDFAWVHLDETPNFVSQSSWLRQSHKNKIGTHTTRYKQLKKLEKNQLAVLSDQVAIPTVLGQVFFSWVRKQLTSTAVDVFSLNALLHDLLDGLSKIREKESARVKSDKFLGTFYASLRPFLISLNKPKRLKKLQDSLEGLLADAERETARLLADETPDQEEEVEKTDAVEEVGSKQGALIQLVGLNDILTEDTVRDLYTGNLRAEAIVRLIPKPVFDYPEEIDRLCNIDPGIDVEYLAWGNLDLLEKDGEKTVYRTRLDMPVSENKISQIRAAVKMKAIEARDAESEIQPEVIAEKDISAHQPLHLKNIRRRDIKGPTGFLLAEEYNLPWRLNVEWSKMRERGVLNPAKYACEVHEAEIVKEEYTVPQASWQKLIRMKEKTALRDKEIIHVTELQLENISRYNMGKVHNFESALCSMLNKYQVPFSITEKIMQEMYLS